MLTIDGLMLMYDQASDGSNRGICATKNIARLGIGLLEGICFWKPQCHGMDKPRPGKIYPLVSMLSSLSSALIRHVIEHENNESNVIR
jgi:hypothetical protein